MTEAAVLPLVSYGLLLGWSVAWPPGPINAEIVRRGLAQGFGPAYGVGLGASTGDAVWAVAVALGAGALIGSAAARSVLSVLSTLLLLLLAAVYLRGAWRGIAAWRRGAGPDAPARLAGGRAGYLLGLGLAMSSPWPARLAGGRAGYLLGLGLAMSSPWNVAFWLAIIGRAETLQAGPAGSLIVAGAVLLGTNLWVLLLCSAVVVLRVRFGGGAWEAVAKGATGLLMLVFAADGIGRVAAMLPY